MLFSSTLLRCLCWGGFLVSVPLVPQAGWPIGFWVIFLSPLHSAESQRLAFKRDGFIFVFIRVCVVRMNTTYVQVPLGTVREH